PGGWRRARSRVGVGTDRRGDRHDGTRGAAGRLAALRAAERVSHTTYRRRDGNRDAAPRNVGHRRDRALHAGPTIPLSGAPRRPRACRVAVEETMDITLAFCSISALDRSLADAAAAAATAGLRALEVTAHPPHLDPMAGVEAARAAARNVRAAGVEIVAYGSYLGRFGQIERAHAAREAALAAALETRLLRVWAEPIPDGSSDLSPVLDLLRCACDAAAADGITVVVERHLGSFADTPEQIDRLLDAIDRPNVALNYQVLDFLPCDAAAAQPADAARLASRARYCHLKNYQRNPQDGG